VGAGERAELGGQREGDQIVVARQKPGLQALEPGLGTIVLALGAMSIAAGVVGIVEGAAVVALVDGTAWRACGSGR
jgi:hypothetical protein